jgi:UDP-N-acetylmuramyl pentapeptide phosphotransferase/UDP-N-acetylglucosamine-1-phosphate transferase
VVLLISLLDDVRGVPTILRLAAHLAASGYFAAVVVFPDHGLLAAAAATLAIAWMANLYNFMDGADGLAGGMALIGFSCYGVAAGLAGDSGLALVSFSVAAAAAGFLLFNFHPARVFLGDAGSVPLGFLAAALGLVGWLAQHWPAWFPLLVFAPFIVDASVTLACRLAQREKVWQAHRDHYYQRLVLMGWGHRKTALAEYALMAASGLLALVALALPAEMQVAALVFAAVAYLVLIALIEYRWRQRAGSENTAA